MSNKPEGSKSIIITGASSGIGKALAYEFAARGYHLGLIARRLKLLEEIGADIEKRYATQGIKVVAEALDVTNYGEVLTTLTKLAEVLGRVDVVIANAGIEQPRWIGEGCFESDQRIIETNLLGAMATIEAAVRIFKKQGGGHVVGVSSIGAFRGLPGNAAYSASKAGLSVYLEGLRCEARKANILVTTLYPGFIDTPLHGEKKFKPFEISAAKAAATIANKIESQVKTSIFPALPWVIMGWLYKIIPDSALLWMKTKTTNAFPNLNRHEDINRLL